MTGVKYDIYIYIYICVCVCVCVCMCVCVCVCVYMYMYMPSRRAGDNFLTFTWIQERSLYKPRVLRAHESDANITVGFNCAMKFILPLIS